MGVRDWVIAHDFFTEPTKRSETSTLVSAAFTFVCCVLGIIYAIFIIIAEITAPARVETFIRSDSTGGSLIDIQCLGGYGCYVSLSYTKDCMGVTNACQVIANGTIVTVPLCPVQTQYEGLTVVDIWDPDVVQLQPAVLVLSTGDFPDLLVPHGSYVLSKVLTKNETHSPTKRTVDWYRSAVLSTDNTDMNYLYNAEIPCQNLPDYDQNLFETSYYTHLEVVPTYTEINVEVSTPAEIALQAFSEIGGAFSIVLFVSGVVVSVVQFVLPRNWVDKLSIDNIAPKIAATKKKIRNSMNLSKEQEEMNNMKSESNEPAPV